jgi:hypothetical protein
VGVVAVLLMKPKAWTDKYFAAGSAPPEATLQRWMARGEIPAKKVGGTWFIDEHAWLAGGDELVERVLRAG